MKARTISRPRFTAAAPKAIKAIVLTASGLIGGRALIVNAVEGEAADFWKRRGFIPSEDDPHVLFRSIADIAASINAASRAR